MKPMSSVLKLLSQAIALVLALSTSTLSHAVTGNEGSGGGDLRAMQFVKIGEKIVECLERCSGLPDVLKTIDTRALKKAVQKTSVESTNEVLLLPSGASQSAVTKDALNWFGKTRIVFNREAWDTILDGSRRAALVLHEYLGIMGVDDRDYRYSKLLFENNALKMSFNYMAETQEITEGLEFDFAIKCTINFRGQEIDELDPLGSRMSPDGRIFSKVGSIGRDLVWKDDYSEVLQLRFYDDSDANVGLIGIPISGEKAIHIVLGWTKNWFFSYPERVIFDQKVKLTPNFRTEMSFPELELKYECHRMLEQELSKEPFFVPVGM